MAVSNFNFSSLRSYKARLGVAMAPVEIWLTILAIVLVLGAVFLLIMGLSIGWGALAVGVILIMPIRWYQEDLHIHKPTLGGKTIDDVLDGDILGRLPENPSPYDLAISLSLTAEGVFFMRRFGVSSGMIRDLVSKDSKDVEVVFNEAMRLRSELALPSLTAGMILIALLRQVPQSRDMLAHLQLEESDLVAGIKWFARLEQQIENYKHSIKNPGGIGRDWSFGWIPNLSHFGQNISEGLSGLEIHDSDIQAHREALNLIIKSMASEAGNSLALVGSAGVGKTELIKNLANIIMSPTANIPSNLRYHQVFLLDAAAIVAQAKEPGDVELILNQILSEAARAKNIIVVLDGAQVFFENGVGSVDASNVLLPIIKATALPLILTFNDQRFAKIVERQPEVANVLTRVNLQPPEWQETLLAVEDKLVMLEYRYKVTYMYQAIKAAYDLSTRYVHEMVQPGRTVKLLESAASYAVDGFVTNGVVDETIEKTIGVKVAKIGADDDERQKLVDLENLLHARVIGQEYAIKVVSDALRRARAGVRNQNRPIGTFMFMGPTGVGKTELAKALAAVYFGDENKIVRLDMNEFVEAKDVARLIADGADNPGSLTAQVMRQPFSVVLLDELEKAHSAVLQTLLQLLDEGILRDANNREISFRDTIVIATSNAAVERITELLQRGMSLDTLQDQLTNELINSHIFAPEFLNRFDEIVLFGSLSKEQLLRVVDLILASINKTLESQKITVTLPTEAKVYLVDKGYDPGLGARPMRRIIQKSVENIVAQAVLANKVQAGGELAISLDDIKKELG